MSVCISYSPTIQYTCIMTIKKSEKRTCYIRKIEELCYKVFTTTCQNNNIKALKLEKIRA